MIKEIIIILLFPLSALAWNNETIKTDLHPKVTNFEVTETGYIASMEDNTQVIYTWIHPDLLKGEWEDAYFYVCKGDFYYAGQLKELSICISNL